MKGDGRLSAALATNRLSDVQWRNVQLAYETTSERIGDICKRFGLSRRELARRRRAENWRKRGSAIADLATLRRDQARGRSGEAMPDHEDLATTLETAQSTILTASKILEVRRLYEAGEMPVRTIRERYGLTEHALRTLRKTGGWETRLRVADPTGSAPDTVASKSNELARRLLKALGRQVVALETRTMREGYAPTPQDARLTDELARSAKRISQIVDQSATARGSANARAGRSATSNDEIKKEEAEAADVEWIRDQLQRRVAVLAQRTRSGGSLAVQPGQRDPEIARNDQLGGVGPSRSETTGE